MTRVAFVLFIMLAAVWARPASAVPSFAQQTGLPCVTCHVGSFGPQLKPFGRQFKLNGYTLDDGQDHFPPLSAMLQTSFSHTSGGRPGGASAGFGQTACAGCHPGQFGSTPPSRNNVALDDVSAFLAGKLTDNLGAFAEISYSEVSNQIHWDNVDIRYANSGTIAGKDFVYGVDINNNPTVEDLWNSTPVWSFPFAQSLFAPGAALATQIDGSLAQTVIGAGLYAQWNDLLYLEVTEYHDIGTDLRRKFGITPATGQNMLEGLNPYWRAALLHSEGPHDFELGTYGIAERVFPTAVSTFGTDRYWDTAFDAQYQYIPNDDFNIGAYATWINERQDLQGSHDLIGAPQGNRLRTWRGNVSMSFEDTYTLNARYFRTQGTTDAQLIGDFTGSANSAGEVYEIDWAPGGKPDSFMPSWLNLKLSAQYVVYQQFDGSTANAAENNALFFLAWFAWPLD